ncbi:hypothetical protein [Oceanobacillus sp. CFH 90083]|uniref:hypothetical protein n=1 Tax=Oceanobacillus sp. CFH 90083 TaxID=2592336 RepID=UPI001883491B|nr:hypothetical protein [Oceanobacillus sp. CFH 90083]
MKILFYAAALLAGVTLSVEGAIYAAESSLYNFAVGTIILGIALFLKKGTLSYTAKALK